MSAGSSRQPHRGEDARVTVSDVLDRVVAEPGGRRSHPLLAALAPAIPAPVVRLRVDGESLTVAFQVDTVEHTRRRSAGVGAVTSTGLLHALWLIPRGVPVAETTLPEVKASRLRDARGFASLTSSGFVRDYEPAGRVVAVSVVGRDAQETIDRVACQPPVFQRVATLTRRPRLIGLAADAAARAGVGLLVAGAGGAEVLVAAPLAVRGVPGVFRWWLAELAYRELVQDSTQPVS